MPKPIVSLKSLQRADMMIKGHPEYKSVNWIDRSCGDLSPQRVAVLDRALKKVKQNIAIMSHLAANSDDPELIMAIQYIRLANIKRLSYWEEARLEIVQLMSRKQSLEEERGDDELPF